MAIYERLFKEFQSRAKHVSDLVPWRLLAAPGVVLNKDRHALMRTYLVRGQDLTGGTPEQQGAVMLQANNVLKRLGGQWVVHAEAQRTALTEYPRCVDEAPAVAKRIDEARRRQLLSEPGARETRYYLTLTWMPPSVATKAARRLLVADGTTPEASGTTDYLTPFLRDTDALMGLLRGVLATCRPATTSELLTYLHTTVSDRWHPIPALSHALDLDTQLCDAAYMGLQPQVAENLR